MRLAISYCTIMTPRRFRIVPTIKLNTRKPAYSAEWQANMFAFYFLLPDRIVAAYTEIEQLSAACSITQEIAKQRVGMLPKFSTRYVAHAPAICPDCGDFVTIGGNCSSPACKGSGRSSK